MKKITNGYGIGTLIANELIPQTALLVSTFATPFL